MTTRTRKIFVAVAFAATVAAAVTGATLSGETREAPTVAEACATAEWPLIPAECLDGAAQPQRTGGYRPGGRDPELCRPPTWTSVSRSRFSSRCKRRKLNTV